MAITHSVVEISLKEGSGTTKIQLDEVGYAPVWASYLTYRKIKNLANRSIRRLRRASSNVIELILLS
jgi:hypothetical protein